MSAVWRPRVYRQGDCVIQEVLEIPSNARMAPNSDGVALTGETGKQHTLQLQKGSVYTDQQRNVFFEVRQPTLLEHADHKALTVEPGYYTMRGIRSFERPYTEGRPQNSGD